MRHGIVILPDQAWSQEASRWARAEELGFDHAWTYDHLSWRSLSDGPWRTAIPTLVAAAGRTRTIGLGTLVATPNFRHPVMLASEVSAADDIAGGRLLVGIGAGADTSDAYVLGQPALSPAERHDRFEEFSRHLDRLLRNERPGESGITLDGSWFRSVEARMVAKPGARSRIPSFIAANGPRGIALAAGLGDGWITMGRESETQEQWWASVEALARRTDGAAPPAGFRRFLSLDGAPGLALQSAAHYEDAVGRAADLGFTDVVSHWPRPSGVYAGHPGVLDDIAALIARS